MYFLSYLLCSAPSFYGHSRPYAYVRMPGQGMEVGQRLDSLACKP